MLAEPSNPLVVGSAGGVATLTGVNVYANYRSGLIHNDNTFTNMESGARKKAEMGKIHAHHTHEISLAAAEYTAQRVGEQMEKATEIALENVMARHQQPDPCLSCITDIKGHQPSLAAGR